MLSVATVNYLIYSEEEIEQWKADSLEFYIGMKEQSNVTKGNFLRAKTYDLIGAIDFQFSEIFKEFCT